MPDDRVDVNVLIPVPKDTSVKTIEWLGDLADLLDYILNLTPPDSIEVEIPKLLLQEIVSNLRSVGIIIER